jgi:DNA-binding winged helix-turn-helix (wHTH) protein
MHQIEVLDLIVEPNEYLVHRNGEVINLPKLSFELLINLIENAQKICSLEELSLAVWKNNVVSNETIIQRITLLRKALDDDPKAPKYIESVRGRGYRLIVKPIHKSQTNHKKKLLSACIAVALVCLALVIYWLTTSISQKTLPPSTDRHVKSEETTDSVSSFLERGNYYLDIGQNQNIDRAIVLFNEVLTLEPANINALIGLSLALSKSVCRYNQPTSRAQKAKQLAIQALTIDSNSSNAQAALAYSWDCIGNLELALEHYLLSIKLNPQNYKSTGSAAHLLETKGQLMAAFNLSQRAKQLKPDNHMADLQIARIFELLKFTSQAQASYQKLFMLYPDNVFINEAYPRFLFFQGRFSEAKNVIEKVLKRDIERRNIFLYYAELLWLLEGKEKALPWILKAVEVNPRQSYAETIRLIVDKKLTVEEANNRIHQLEKVITQGDTWPINYIESSLLSLWVINNKEDAIGFLQKAVNLGYLNSEYLTISPLFAQLRKQPKFYQLIDDINRHREQMNQRFLAAYAQPDIE